MVRRLIRVRVSALASCIFNNNIVIGLMVKIQRSDFMKIRGTQKVVPEIEVNIDTVYIRTNITKVEEEDFSGWEYDEIQYKKDTYIQMMAEQSNLQDNYLLDLDFRLSLSELGV